MQHSMVDASATPAPVQFIETQLDMAREEASPLTSEMADSDPSVSKAVDEGPMKSTAGVAFEQNENGIRFSVPVTESAILPKNLDEETYREGYDSDGERGPFYDAVISEMEQWDDSDSDSDDEFRSPSQPTTDAPLATALPATGELSTTPPDATAGLTTAPPTTDSALQLMTEQQLMNMTVAQLKQELERRKLSKSGVKNVLVQRLLSAQNAPPPPPPQNINVTTDSRSNTIADEANHRSKDLQVFHPNARWRELMHSGSCQEPERPANLRGPSVPLDESEFKKFNFDEEWDRPPFTGMSKVIKMGSRGHPLVGKKGETLYGDEVRKEGRANYAWLKKRTYGGQPTT